MSNFRNVSKREPCPICGKPDWCSIQEASPSTQLYYCRRILSGIDIISPVNNREYVYIKQTTDGSCLYKDREQYDADRDEWLLQNSGYNQRRPRKERPKQIPSDQSENRMAGDTLSVPAKPNHELDLIYRSFLKHLHLNRMHVRYLAKEGWPIELIQRSMLRSLPVNNSSHYNAYDRERITLELIHEFGSVKGVPGFYQKQDGKWTFSGTSGILIPLYDHNHCLYRLRIRLDHPQVDDSGKEKNKYNNFSSYFETKTTTGALTNAYINGCRSGSHIGLYDNPTLDDYTVCYITEGEKKAIYANHVLRIPVISIPGVNSFSKLLEQSENGFTVLDYLKSRGCRILIIAYDSDKYINHSVLMYEDKIIEFLSLQDFHIGVAFWNPGFGKGLDDILSINIRPNYELVKENTGV